MVVRRSSRGVVGLPVASRVAAATKRRRSTKLSSKSKTYRTRPPHEPDTRPTKWSIDNPILIDNRAGSKELPGYYPLYTHSQLCRLPSADVCITGNGPRGEVIVGVEVKSLTELISSFSNGRLQDTQLLDMVEVYSNPGLPTMWLLYYGIYRPSPVDGYLEIFHGKKRGWETYHIGSRPVPYGYVESFLLTASAVGVNIKRVQHFDKDEALSECAQWIACLARWWDKKWTEHKGMHAFDFSGAMSMGMPGIDEHTKMLAKFAMQLSGVGYDRALAVARHFQSIIDMVAADESEWSKIPGIGKVIAGSAVSEIRRRMTMRERNKKR